MKEKIESIEKKVDQILDALKGNDMGTTGIVPRLEKCERKISILNSFKIKVEAIKTFITAIIATVLTLIVTYLSN